jgi:hypothetical protein
MYSFSLSEPEKFIINIAPVYCIRQLICSSYVLLFLLSFIDIIATLLSDNQLHTAPDKVNIYCKAQ